MLYKLVAEEDRHWSFDGCILGNVVHLLSKEDANKYKLLDRNCQPLKDVNNLDYLVEEEWYFEHH